MSDGDFEPTTGGTLGGLLRHLAARRPQAEALVYPAFVQNGQAERLTFAALDAYVDDLARGLMACGLRAGDHVALWAPNLLGWVPLEFALARIGAVLVTVNTALRGDEVAYILRQSHARAVIHSTRTGNNEASALLDELLEDAERRPPALELRLWIGGPGQEAPVGVLPEGGRAVLTSVDDLSRRAPEVSASALAERESGCAPHDVVNIQYTSGTTGFPKGVMLSHRNVLSSALMLGDQLRITPDDRVALIVPLFHCFGCVVAVLGAYTHGATLCAIPAFDPTHALRLVHEERCTIIHGVPTMFDAMLRDPLLKQVDTSSLRAGLAAGAPCPVSLMERIATHLQCAGITVAYGLTEASPGVSGCNPEDPIQVRYTTIGPPLPGVEVRVVDVLDGRDLPDGEAGELWVRGPNVMVGYHDDPVATAAALAPGGWLRTGDLGLRGDDGNLRIVGRAKDIIIRGGENIAPAEIENALRGHPDVLDAAVVGLPDPHFGEEVAAALVLSDGAALDPAALTAYLSSRLAPFKIPRHWRVMDRLPLTGSGKVQKYKLREQLGGEG